MEPAHKHFFQQSAPPTIAQLPVRLRDLLKREVCLDISRLHIEAALSHVERETEELRKTKPPFLFLHAKPTRIDFQNRESGAVETLAALTRGLQNLDALKPRVHAWVNDDLETFLRDSQPAYMLGLATHRYYEDWNRALLRFDQRVSGFRSALGQLLAALGTVPSGMVLASHPSAFEQLMSARQWGTLLDYEFLFFNRVADLQRRASELGGGTLNRTPDHQFGNHVAQWARVEAEVVRRSLVELRARLEVAAKEARAIYSAETALAGANAVSYFAPMREALTQLMRFEIDPEEVQNVVAETERMVISAGG